YYMSIYSCSKGEAAMPKEEVLIAIDAEAVEAARAAALPEAHLLLLVETFQALADPTRARILYALTMRPMCVRDLAILVGVSASAVSHQLRGRRSPRGCPLQRGRLSHRSCAARTARSSLSVGLLARVRPTRAAPR